MTRSQTNKLVAIVTVLIILVVVIFAFGPFYILQEGEQAVIVRFGEIVNVNTEAGIGLKLPLVDNVVIYTKKILSWDGAPMEMPTEEKQFIYVDTTARWRIKDPKLFYSRLVTVERAESRLSANIDSAVRTIIADNSMSSAVRNSNIINERPVEKTSLITTNEDEESSEVSKELLNLIETAEKYPSLQSDEGRRNLSKRMLESSKAALEQFGIEIIDLLIRQIRYTDQVTQNVYERMISERNRIAQAYRSVGEGQKKELEGQMQNELKSIMSEAYRQSEIIKGTADAQAAQIYTEAYRQDPEFFRFWRALESYRKTLGNFDKTLSTDMDYFNYLYNINGR